MPRGTRKKSFRKSYRECDSDDSGPENDGGLGMFSSLLGFLIQQNHPAPRRRTSAGRPSKRRKPTNDCQSHCHCCHCKKAAPKKTCTAKKSKSTAKGKGSNIPVASTSTEKDVSIDIDSEDEVASTAVTETQAVNIKNKVDTFFKGLESEDEEFGDKLKAEKISVPTEKKSKDFYTLLSDSDDEKDKKKKDKVLDDSIDNPIATTSSILDKPSTSGLIVSTFGPGLKMVTNSLNLNSEKKTEDLFAYVDDILNECNEIVDITDSKTKENVPVSLEDLKKRTDEILGGCASLMDDLNPKPKEPEKKAPESPTKEAPTCPICLEHLGGSKQAMATLCGHMFCEPCILQVVKSTKKCPSCRKGLTKAKYHPVYI